MRDKEKGSTLVMAIVAMTFVSLLGLAVVALTVSNIQMKQSEKESQANFYDVDSIMDEIRAGVKDMSVIASTDAYSRTLSAYSSVLSGVSSSLQDKYNDAYMEKMVQLLSDGNETFNKTVSSYHFYDDVLRKYLSGTNMNFYVSQPGGHGNLTYKDGALILEKIKVECTERGYTTTLVTDIRVTVPPLTSETHSEYLDYALIADNQIKAVIGGSASVGVDGSIYSGTVERDSMTTDPEAGIVVGAGTKLSISARDLISRGDILVKGGSSFEAKGTSEGLKLWVENILTKAEGSTAGNKISIDGDINVADDLELNSEADNVTLTGNYYGYNYNNTYDTANVAKVSSDSKMSSAVLINGRKCTLNMSGLGCLVLAGRTFISKNSGSEVYDYDTSQPVINRDIMMGESLSVKGTQLAYYVPTDFIKEEAADPALTYPYDMNGKIYFQYSTEPSKAYVFDYAGYNSYINVANFDVRTYIDTGVPLTYYYRNDPDIAPVTYFYLNFADKDKASKFYSVFSKSSPKNDTIKDVNKEFVSNAGISLAGGNAIFIRSGNILYKDPSSNNFNLKLTNESVNVDEQLQKYAPQKAHQYMSKQMALLDSYDVVSSSSVYRLLSTAEAGASVSTKVFSKSGYVDGAKQTNLFDKLIDRTKLVAKGDINSPLDGFVVHVTKDDYIWDSSQKTQYGNDKGIIIAGGNVELKTDFSGMIIAGGDISFSTTGVKINSDPETVAKLFSKDKASSTPYFVDMFTTYFRTVVDASIGTVGSTEDNVTYENWDKK